MLYNPSIHDEIEHSHFAATTKEQLYFCNPTLDNSEMKNLISSGSRLDKTFFKKIHSEIISNRLKINPLKSIKEEKANSDILFSNPEMITMNPESSKKLLEIKDSNGNQEKFSNFYIKNQMEQLANFSEYLYNFSAINRKSTINELGSIEETEKSLKSLDETIIQSKEILDNYFKLIPIMEQFSDIDLENCSIKLKLLKEIMPNIEIIINTSNLNLIKMHDNVHEILNKLDKVIQSLEENVFEDKPELKKQLMNIFSFIYYLSSCFKFSFGFFTLARYLKKFKLEYEFNESMDFSQLRKIGENDFNNGSYTKDWHLSKIELSHKSFSYEYFKNFEKIKEDKTSNPLCIFEYLPKITSHCNFGNKWFFYNHIYGLIKFSYCEETNSLTCLERNSKAFNLKKGFILSIGSGDSGLICFVSNSILYEEKEENEENGKMIENANDKENEFIQVLFSEHINYKNVENLQTFSDRLKNIFNQIKNWLENSLNSNDPNDVKNFVYTDQKITIPLDHVEENKKSDLRKLLKEVVFHAKNNLIYCLRPILKLKKRKENFKHYFSENYVYSIDIFDLNLDSIKKEIDTDCSNNLVKNIKSCVLINNEKNYFLQKEKQEYSHIECFLDKISKNNFKNLIVNAGKLILLSPTFEVFVYDLIFNNFEITNKIKSGEENNEFTVCFLSKKNCLVFMREVKKDPSLVSFESCYETKALEVSLPSNFEAYNEFLYYKLSMEGFNRSGCKDEQKDSNKFTKIKLNLNNLRKTEKIEESKIEKEEEIYDNNRRNSLLNIFSCLGLSAAGKLDERNFLKIEDVILNRNLSYNDSMNFKILFELLKIFSEEILNSKVEDHKFSENSYIFLSILNIFKLHVNNNSRLGWDFGIYFDSKAELQENIKHLFEILVKTIEKIYDNTNKRNNNANFILESITFVLMDILFEILSFNFSKKDYFVNLLADLLKNLILNKVKLINADLGTDQNIKELNKNADHLKSLFNSNLILHLLNNFNKLFSKNSNFIIACLINETLGDFILNSFNEYLDAVDKNLKKPNSNSLLNINLFDSRTQSIETMKTELFYFNQEKILSELLIAIYVKYMNTILNFGKKPFGQNFESILEDIFNSKNFDIVNLKKKLTNFVIDLSKKFFESGILLADYLKVNNINLKLLKNNYLLNNINNILNFMNLINFEIFPDFIFTNWSLILNLLQKLSDVILSENKQKHISSQNSNSSNSLSLVEDKTYSALIKDRKAAKSLFKTQNAINKQNIEKIIDKFDITIDNFNIDDTIKASSNTININLQDLIRNNSNNPNFKMDQITNVSTDIFIYFCVVYPEGNSENKKGIIEFSEIDKAQCKISLKKYEIDHDIKIEDFVIRRFPINAKLAIDIENHSEEDTAKTILYKIRISNYEFHEKTLSFPISSASSFVNKTIKFLSFYENANLLNNLNVNEDVKDLISSSVFSGGIKDSKKLVAENKKLNSINKDLEIFFVRLNEENKSKLEFLNDQIDNNPFGGLQSNSALEASNSKNFNALPTDCATNTSNFITYFMTNNIPFESLISIKDMDLSECEEKSLEELTTSEKKVFYLLKKLFLLFDFLIEKVNREYIVKGPIIDKIVLGLFFICIKQNRFSQSLEKILDAVFNKEENYKKYATSKLIKEDCVNLLESKNFEEIFFIWKNCCQVRKIFKAQKDLIFQQMDENFGDKKINLEFEKSEIEISKINCNIDPDDMEDKEILKYFERYLQKLKLLFYLKSNPSKKNNKLNSLRNFKSNSFEIKENSVLPKKNLLHLSNLIKKTMMGINIDDKKEFNHKEKSKVKDLANDLISAISNDNINVDNILACLQSLNVKIKFREISLFIINNILKNFKNSEIKADLISNFYQNFRLKSSNQIPNILDHLNTTSTDQSAIVTNLFHEYIFNILDELNSLFNKNQSELINTVNSSEENGEKFPEIFKGKHGNSNFYTIILLNNLIWQMKGRNFQFLLDIQFFHNLFNNNKNEILKLAKNGMFLDPRTLIYNESISIASSKFCYYDIFYVSSLMTDIFSIYSNIIIKRILKEKMSKAQNNTPSQKNGLGLTRSMSNLDLINNSDLIIHILDIYKMIIEDFLENTLFKNKEEFYKKIKPSDVASYQALLKQENQFNIQNIPSENLILLNNLFYSQRKIWNISISLLKNIIIQDSSIEIIFKDLSLFSRLLVFLLFANEKNVYLIFGILNILVSHLNKNSQNFEYFGNKIKDLYKQYILPFKKKNSNINENSQDLLAHLSNEELEQTNSYEFFLRFLLSLKFNSSKLRVNKDLIYFEKKIFNNSNNIQNIIDSSIEDKINEFLRFFLSQSQFKNKCFELLSSLALNNGVQVAKILDSNIGYLNNFSKIICNSKIEFNSSNYDKVYDPKDIEALVKKGTLIYDKSVYYLHEKASKQLKDSYEAIHENLTEDCIVKGFLEDNGKILNQIETNRPNLLFPTECEYIINDEFIDSNSLIFGDEDLIKNILIYLTENLIEKNNYTLNHLQSYIRIVKFLKKLTLITTENIRSIFKNNKEENIEEELNEIEETIIQEKIQQVEKLKKIVQEFFNTNKEFFEYFLVFDDVDLPANILNINKLENILFSYTPYDIKMLSKNKSENLLNFENPLKRNEIVNLFPLGIKPNSKENLIEINDINLAKVSIPEIKQLYLKINFENQNIFFTPKSNNDIALNLQINLDNYSYLFEEEGKNTSEKMLRRIGKYKQIEIFDSKKATQILEEYKANPDPKQNENKSKHRAIFLTNEFLREINLEDLNKQDVKEYLSKIKNENSQQENNSKEIEEKKETEEKKENEEVNTTKENEEVNTAKENIEVNITKENLTESNCNQKIFEKYLNNNYFINKCVLILNDEHFDKINKNFSCFSIDYSLLENNIKEFLENPTECSDRYEMENKKADANNKYISIFYYLVSDITRFFISNEESKNKIKEDLAKFTKVDLEKISIFNGYLNLIELQAIEASDLKDFNMMKNRKFEEINDNTEKIQFEDQKEADIKNLGMHILKQHLRFLCLKSVNEYALWEESVEINESNIENYSNLLKYFKLLYYQSLYKDNYFNLKLEHTFILSKINLIVKKLLSQGTSKSVKALFNYENFNIIDLLEDLQNENKLRQFEQRLFLNDLFKGLKENLEHFETEKIQKSYLELCKILSTFLNKDVSNCNPFKIECSLINLKSFIEIVNSIIEKNKHSLSESNKKFIEEIALELSNNQSIRKLTGIISQKKSFVFIIIDFVLIYLKFLYDCNNIIESEEINLNLKSFNKTYLELFDCINNIEYKFKSKILTEKIIKSSKEYEDIFSKKFKIPNLKNSFCFTLKENKFKNFEVKFVNSKEKLNESLSICNLFIDKKEKTEDSRQEVKLNYEFASSLGETEFSNYLNTISLDSSNKKENQIMKTLIYADNSENFAHKNYLLIKDSNNPEPTLYNLPKNVSDVWLVKEERAILIQQGNKLLVKGNFLTVQHPNFKTTEVLENIAKSEQILKIFDSGVIVTNKYIYAIHYLYDYIDSSYRVNEHYRRIALGPIKNPKKICWGHLNDYGIVLVDIDGRIYSAGRCHYGTGTDYAYNYHLTEITIFGQKKCRKAYVVAEACAFLMEEDDGKLYLYASGYNYDHLCVVSRSEYYFPSGKVKAVENIPMKKMVCVRNCIICLSEKNEIYYCGYQYDEYFSCSSRSFYVPALLDWPKKNNFTPTDIIRGSKDTIFINMVNNETGNNELFMFGQSYLFRNGSDKYFYFNDSPFKCDLQQLVEKNREKLKNKDETKEEKMNENKDENIGINIEDNTSKKDQKNKEKVENMDVVEEEFIISRFEIRKKIKNPNLDEEEENNENKTVNQDEEKDKEENINDKQSLTNDEYSILTTEKIDKNFKIKDVKVMNCSDSQYRLSVLLGYHPVKRNFSMNLLEEKLNSILSDSQGNKIENKVYLSSFNQKHALCIVNNKNKILNNYVFDNIQNDTAFIYISVLENSENYLISPMLFHSKQELLEQTKFQDLNLLELLESKVNTISNYSNNINSENLLENIHFENIDLEDNCLSYIKENLNELLSIFFIADNLIINKNRLNENYSTDNNYKNLTFSIKCTDSNIEKLYENLYAEVKKKVTDKFLNNLKTSILENYNLEKFKFEQTAKTDSNNLKENFNNYICEVNKKDPKFFGYFDSTEKVEFVKTVMNYLNHSISLILELFDPEIDNEMTKLIFDNIYLVEKSYKEKFINLELEKLSLNDNRQYVYIDRMAARKFQNSKHLDKKFEKTVFSQVYRGMKTHSDDEYFKKLNILLFRVDLKGENATDAGGPAREIFTQMFEDLMSKRLDLFIPTPNQQAASGLGRDLWTINPTANTIYHLDVFGFIGKVFAYSFISKVYCPIYLPNLVWKSILQCELKPEDLEEIDILAYNSIVRPCLNPDLYFEELYALFDYQTFTAALSNGEEVELCDGGKNKTVSQENYAEFIKLYLEARYREVKEQANAILKGMSPEELAERVAGPKTFDVQFFKENTRLSGYNESDRVIQFFWKFIENCTIEQRIQYLKFCWGRTTLPSSSNTWDQKHTINNISLSPNSLPIAHTCFFSIDLPNYSSYEILKQKLLYAMNNSFIITDGSSLELDL